MSRQPRRRLSEPEEDESEDSAPPLRRGKGGRTLWGLVVAGLVVTLTLGGWLVVHRDRRPKAIPEDAGQRRREVMQAFHQPLPLDEKEIARDVKPFFDSLGAALRARNGTNIVDHFDMDRLADELIAMDFFPALIRRDRHSFVSGLRLGMVRAMRQEAFLLEWADVEVRGVKRLSDDEAVLIVRHRDKEGNFQKIRWWLIRRTGSWKVYDLEDLDVGLRISTAVASFADLGMENLAGAANTMKHVRDALLAIATQQDADAAERHLRQAEGGRLPPKLDSLRHLIRGMIGVHRNAFQDALKAFDQAHRCHPDMPILDLLRGLAHNRLGEWAKGLEYLEAYHRLLGDDPNVCCEMGLSLRGVKRFAEAAQSYRKALDMNPKDADALLGLLGALAPGDKRDDLGPRFAKLDDPRENFEHFAEDCRETQDADSVAHLVSAMRKIDPQFPAVDFFDALAQAWTGRDDRAIPLFKAALAKQKDAQKRKEYIQGFLGAMAKAGKAVPAYAAAPDATEAFRILAAELRPGYGSDEMRRLVLAHRRKVPRDPLLPFYQAEVHVADGNYQLADRAFQAGMASPPNAATLAEFRASRVLARFHTGQMLSAYTEIGPRRETFPQLVQLCLGEDDLSQLQALLDAHAKVSPKDPEAVWFRCRLKARQKQVPEAIDLLQQALAKQPEEEQTQRVETFLSDMLAAGKMLEGYRAAPDARKAFRHLADELQEEDRPEELNRLVETHRQHHPDDPWGVYYQGAALLEEKAWDRAVQVLGQAWKKATREDRQVFRWSYVSALYRTGRALQAYAEVEPQKDTFNQLANLLIADAKWKELEDLITARRAHAAEDPDLLFNEARARVGLKRSAEAIPLLQKAYQRQTADPQKSSYVSTFVLDMERHGQGLEGYRAAPDKVSAFRPLASKFLADKKERELEKLLQEHGMKHAGDLWYSYYLGELHLLRGDLQKSEQQFAAALAKAGPQEEGMCRSALFRAKVKAGKTVDAYLQARPGTRPFEELARLCLAQKDARQLGALLAAHRRADPDDSGLPVWELEVHWLRRDYEGALKLLAEHREDVFAQQRHRWKYQDSLVRALVRLNRPQQAVTEAEAFLKGKHANPVLLVLAYAAQGDVKRATATAEQYRLDVFRLAECYRDVDLGPLLRRTSFREFRKKFPEPKETE
ncbi:MAG: tetratricopeptide repeat protein [Planctomycetes bacterium]|nr:tetratricopeptide repeat protein [Planctomycetota bacterium]